ncbi:MAG: 3-hydroxyacyl-CoA dehydrogenase family protein, partial [Gemmatimonadales bacterium]
MSTVAVIGSGTMGNGIAQVFAQHEWSVKLIDVSAPALEKAVSTIRKSLERLVKKASLPEEAAVAVPRRITTGTDLGAAADADLVVEAASEKASLKFTLFEELDRVCRPEAILASNTSSIS